MLNVVLIIEEQKSDFVLISEYEYIISVRKQNIIIK